MDRSMNHTTLSNPVSRAPSAADRAVPQRPPVRAHVIELRAMGVIVVAPEAAPPQTWTCELLLTGPVPPELAPGDPVLVLPPSSAEPVGCVLGRIGRYQPAPARQQLCATDELELRCGP